MLKTLKILATRIKEWQHRSKTQNQAQKQQGSKRLKSVKESEIPF
ncbi:hypothetical protein ACLF9C_00150 [Helicobacter pylori]